VSRRDCFIACPGGGNRRLGGGVPAAAVGDIVNLDVTPRTIGRVLAEHTEAGSLSYVGGGGRHCESARLPGTARRRRQIQSPRLVD
jgi:hypothetical protein